MKNVVLYVGEMEFPDKNAAAQRVLANAKIIKSVTDNDVIVVGLNKEKTKDVLDESYRINGILVFEHRYPYTYLEWFNYITDIKYIEKIINHVGEKQLSVIIAYNYPAIALEKLRLYCDTKNIKFISDVSEWYGKSKRNFPSSIIKDFDTFLRMRIVNKRCNNLICASKYLENYYNKICNVINIPSLVEDSNLKFQNSIQVFSERANCRMYSYVGSPGKSKEKDRLDWMIDAFFKLKQEGYYFKLVFVGITKDSLLEHYQNLKDKVEILKNYIEFRGRVSHIEAIKVIIDSDFTLFAREVNRVTLAGFPTKLAETYACKTPVVTTPSSNIYDYIINGKTGYVSDYCDEYSFFEAIKTSITADQSKVIFMKQYLSKYNPLAIINFMDKTEQFFSNLK